MRFVATSGFCLAAAAAACAPSYNIVYEGDARFEHCYALDDSPRATMEQKSACWRDWVQHHTLGQTRDRIEYAQARYRAIDRAPEIPTDEAMMAAAPGVGASRNNATAPLPTSAFAPPPRTDTESSLPLTTTTVTTVQRRTETVETKTMKPAPLQRAPGADCVEACTQAWELCHTECGSNKDKCDGCEERHGTCLTSCVKKLKAEAPKPTKAAKGR